MNPDIYSIKFYIYFNLRPITLPRFTKLYNIKIVKKPMLKKQTCVGALEALVQLEGEGYVNLHHLHLWYARRVVHDPVSVTEYQGVLPVKSQHHRVPVTI